MKKNKLACLFFILVNLTISCSQLKKECSLSSNHYLNKKVFKKVTTMPSFKTGNQNFIVYINEKMISERYSTFTENVMVSFIVKKNGNIFNVKLIGKLKKEYNNFDKKLLNIINRTPKWNPGKCNKKKVLVELFIPIKFTPN